MKCRSASASRPLSRQVGEIEQMLPFSAKTIDQGGSVFKRCNDFAKAQALGRSRQAGTAASASLRFYETGCRQCRHGLGEMIARNAEFLGDFRR